jgi:hypothetical protein
MAVFDLLPQGRNVRHKRTGCRKGQLNGGGRGKFANDGLNTFYSSPFTRTTMERGAMDGGQATCPEK